MSHMDQYLPVGVRNNKMNGTMSAKNDGWFDKRANTIKHNKNKS